MALAVLFITFIGKFKLYGNRYKKSFTNKVTFLIGSNFHNSHSKQWCQEWITLTQFVNIEQQRHQYTIRKVKSYHQPNSKDTVTTWIWVYWYYNIYCLTFTQYWNFGTILQRRNTGISLPTMLTTGIVFHNNKILYWNSNRKPDRYRNFN